MRVWMSLVGCSLLAAGLAGCSPELAQTPLGVEEEGWQRSIKASYPSWQPPRIAPPGIKDNMSSKFVPAAPAPSAEPGMDSFAASETEVVETVTPAAPAAAAADDVVVAAESTEVVLAPAGDELPADVAAPKADAKAAVQADKKVPAKADAKAAVQADKKAPTEFTEYTVAKGDSLSTIARKVYKDGRLYYPILKANEDQLKNNPNRLYPGMKLRIPKL